MAGRLGIDPRPHTLRQLHWMDQAKQEEDWWHTASIITDIRNTAAVSDYVLAVVNGNKISTPKLINIRDVHPFERERRESQKSSRSIIDLFAGWI